MWHHKTRPLTFSLSVDQFHKDDVNHLFSSSQDKYSITIDWSGDHYLGIAVLQLQFHKQKYVISSMVPKRMSLSSTL